MVDGEECFANSVGHRQQCTYCYLTALIRSLCLYHIARLGRHYVVSSSQNTHSFSSSITSYSLEGKQGKLGGLKPDSLFRYRLTIHGACLIIWPHPSQQCVLLCSMLGYSIRNLLSGWAIMNCYRGARELTRKISTTRLTRSVSI